MTTNNKLNPNFDRKYFKLINTELMLWFSVQKLLYSLPVQKIGIHDIPYVLHDDGIYQHKIFLRYASILDIPPNDYLLLLALAWREGQSNKPIYPGRYDFVSIDIDKNRYEKYTQNLYVGASIMQLSLNIDLAKPTMFIGPNGNVGLYILWPEYVSLHYK